MDLKEFVQVTLTQILDGIKEAQTVEGGGVVGALTHSTMTHANLATLNNGGYLAVIDFDVSVGAETSGGAKGGIRVMSIGLEGGGEHKSHELSRVKFAVPVVLPKGSDELVKKFNRSLNSEE